MRVSKEIKKHMSKLGRKGGKALWKGKSKEEKSKIMSERRIKGIQKLAEQSDFRRSKDCGSLEGAGYTEEAKKSIKNVKVWGQQ